MAADKPWGATVMPGYDDTRLGRGSAAFVRARDNGSFYRSTWEGALRTQPAMVSITSFNEWPEGTQIEPGVAYGDMYRTITREYSARLKSQAAAPPASVPDAPPYAGS